MKFLAPYTMYLKIALLALVFWSGWEWRDRSADISATQAIADANKKLAEASAAEADAQAKARATEQAKAKAIADIGAKHEQDKADAKAATDRRIAGLESGNLRLHREIGSLYTERLSRDSAVAGELSEEARRGAERIGAVVGILAEQDAQIRGLQEAYRVARNVR